MMFLISLKDVSKDYICGWICILVLFLFDCSFFWFISEVGREVVELVGIFGFYVVNMGDVVRSLGRGYRF